VIPLRLSRDERRNARRACLAVLFLAALFPAAFCLALSDRPAAASGDALQVSIGGVDIPYTLPAGLSPVSGLFPLDLTELDNEFNMETKVFGMFVPEADLRARAENPAALPEFYMHLAHDGVFAWLTLGDMGFTFLGSTVDLVLQRQYAEESFKKKLEAAFSGTVGVPVRIVSLADGGSIENVPGRRSFLARGSARATLPGGEEEFFFATVTTLHLARGKVLCTFQVRRAREENDLAAFGQEALARARRIWGWP
jgi:hypothetical protein